jgi:hypothetical protein
MQRRRPIRDGVRPYCGTARDGDDDGPAPPGARLMYALGHVDALKRRGVDLAASTEDAAVIARVIGVSKDIEFVIEGPPTTSPTRYCSTRKARTRRGTCSTSTPGRCSTKSPICRQPRPIGVRRTCDRNILQRARLAERCRRVGGDVSGGSVRPVHDAALAARARRRTRR